MRVYSERLMREAMAEAVADARETAVLEGHFGSSGAWEADYGAESELTEAEEALLAELAA